jgi:tol-pal system protein YbgF
MKLSAALLLGLCLVAGTAGAGMFDDEEARKAIGALRVEVEAKQKAAEERLANVESVAQERAIDLTRLIDELKQELARLRGQLEVQVHQIETLERRQKDLYVDLDARLRKLEASAQAQQQQPPASEADPVAEGKSYESALNQFKLGNYQASVAAFQGFLAAFPESRQVSSAQYWIGNAYYALRDYKAAIAAQQKLLESWPDSAKAPDAMLNIASSQAELGQTRTARLTLNELIKKYPGTPAADQAKQRLAGKR